MATDRGAQPGAPRCTGRVLFTVDGRPGDAEVGTSIAAWLLAQGHRSWRTAPDGAPRGLYCGIGDCFDCTLTVDGRPGVRACITRVELSMVVTTDGDVA